MSQMGHHRQLSGVSSTDGLPSATDTSMLYSQLPKSAILRRIRRSKLRLSGGCKFRILADANSGLGFVRRGY